MRKFAFPLEPLLRIRMLEEEQRQREVARLERMRADIEEELRRIQNRLDEGKESVRRAVVGRIDLPVMRSQAQASLAAMRHANRFILQLASLHKQIDRARTALIEASRRRRAVEILRERRFASWRADMEKEEQAALDELAASKHFHEVHAA